MHRSPHLLIRRGAATLLAAALSLAATHAPPPTITSLDPGVVAPGTTTLLLRVRGSGFAPNSQVRWDGRPQPTTFQTTYELHARIGPQELARAAAVRITVFTAGRDGGESNALPFTVGSANPAPRLASISPGYATAGDPPMQLNLHGEGFAAGAVGRWNGQDRPTTVRNARLAHMQVTAEDLASARTVQIAVFNPAPGGGLSAALPVEVRPAADPATVVQPNPAPVLHALEPAGAAAGSPPLTLTVRGAGFVNGSAVVWRGRRLTTSFVDAGTLRAPLAATDLAAPGNADVIVQSPAPGGGNSAALTFAITQPADTRPPTLTAPSDIVVPAQNAQGASINYTASAVDDGGGSVRLTCSPAAGSLFPVGITTVTCTAEDAAGNTASASFRVTVTAPAPTTAASITGLDPANGTPGGGAFTMGVIGSGFAQGMVVRWNGAPRRTVFLTPQRLNANIGATDIASAGSARVTIFDPATGAETGAAEFWIDASRNGVPTLRSVLPTSAQAGGPDMGVTANGDGFVPGMVLRFNGVDRPVNLNGSRIASGRIAASEIAAAGTATVTLFNPGPNGGESAAITFTITGTAADTEPPRFTADMPDISGQFGDSVRVTYTVPGATDNAGTPTVTCIPPSGSWFRAGTTTVTCTATDAAGNSATQAFNVTVTAPVLPVSNPVPAIASLTPDDPLANGVGFELTVRGQGFVPGAVVRWNGADLTTLFIHPSMVQATVPEGSVARSTASRQVTVWNPAPGGGESAPATLTFVNRTATITALEPAGAPAGSGALTLRVRGTGFDRDRIVSWNSLSLRLPTTVLSDTLIEAQVSADDLALGRGPTAAVLIRRTAAMPPAQATFTIQGGLNADPALAAFDLDTISTTATGVSVALTVTGSGFVPASVLRWGSRELATVFEDYDRVRAGFILASSTDPVAITVVNPAPGGGTSNALTYTPPAPLPPLLDTFEPRRVVASSGQFTLRLTGENFTPTTVVHWNDSPRTTRFIGATEVEATIPAADIDAATVRSAGCTSFCSAQVRVRDTVTGLGPNMSALVIDPPLATPVLTSIEPAWTITGSAPTTIVVRGSNLYPGMRIAWGSATRGLDAVNPAGSQASTYMGDLVFANPGVLDMAIFNPTGQLWSDTRRFAIIGQANTLVQSVSPSAWPAGQAGVLYVRGDNFIPSTTVLWNGRALPISYRDPTLLHAALTSGDAPATGPSSAQVTVRTVYSASNTSTVTLTVPIQGANNPVPRLTALNPSSARVGTVTAITVSVQGTGFVPGSVVRVAGVNYTTTFVSATELRVSVPASALATPVSVQVAVFNPAPGGGLSNSLPFTVR